METGIRRVVIWGTRVAQPVERPTLDLGSGHDLMSREFEPHIRLCTDSAEPAWDSVSPSLSAPPLLSLSLKINKQIGRASCRERVCLYV